MFGSKTIWALDVGSFGLKAVKAVKAGGQLQILAAEMIEHDWAAEDDDQRYGEMVEQAVAMLLSKHQITPRERVHVVMPAASVFCRFINLPPVAMDRIPEIVRYEARQAIPFSLDEVIWGYHLTKGEYVPGEEIKIALFAIKREIAFDFLANLAGLRRNLCGLQTSSFAQFNFFSACQPLQKPTVIVDVGAANTDIVIIDGEEFWTRNLPVAGNDITKAIRDKFDISFEEAENVKRQAAQSKHATKVFQVMEPVLRELVLEIQRTIGYYKSLAKEVKFSEVLVTGNAFKLPGMTKFLGDNLQYTVRAVKPAGIKCSDREASAALKANFPAFVPALGLAAQGLGLGKAKMNFLPTEYRTARIMRKLKRCAALAAACLLVVFGTWFAHPLMATKREVAPRPPAASEPRPRPAAAGAQKPSPPTKTAASAPTPAPRPEHGLSSLSAETVQRPATATSAEPSDAPGPASVASAQQAQERSRRWAILIGVNEYEDEQGLGSLKYCVSDMKLLYETLTGAWGGVSRDNVLLMTHDAANVLHRPTLTNMVTMIPRWLQDVGPEDDVIMAFAGHGMAEGDQCYLLPADAKRGNLRLTSVSVPRMRQWLEGCKAKSKVLILDACHSGAGRAPSHMSETMRQELDRGEGYLRIASCNTTEKSNEDDRLGHGVFTYYFAQALKGQGDRDGDGRVGAQEAYKYVFEHVRLWARQKGLHQRPVISGRIKGGQLTLCYAPARERPKPHQDTQARLADLMLRIDPAGCEVLVDGQPVVLRDNGKTAVTKLEPGRHVVVVQKEGYARTEKVVNVDARGNDGTVRLAPTEKHVTVHLKSGRAMKGKLLGQEGGRVTLRVGRIKSSFSQDQYDRLEIRDVPLGEPLFDVALRATAVLGDALAQGLVSPLPDGSAAEQVEALKKRWAMNQDALAAAERLYGKNSAQIRRRQQQKRAIALQGEGLALRIADEVCKAKRFRQDLMAQGRGQDSPVGRAATEELASKQKLLTQVLRLVPLGHPRLDKTFTLGAQARGRMDIPAGVPSKETDRPRLSKPTLELRSSPSSSAPLPDIRVERGQIVTVSASGKWSHSSSLHGPNGVRGWDDYKYTEAANIGALVGKIGKGCYFPIGEWTVFKAPAPGKLTLCMNDTVPGDAHGAIEVTVRVYNVSPLAEAAIDDARQGLVADASTR